MVHQWKIPRVSHSFEIAISPVQEQIANMSMLEWVLLNMYIIDTTYFSAGLDPTIFDYNLTFHTIKYDDVTEILNVTKRFGVKNDVSWLSRKFCCS